MVIESPISTISGLTLSFTRKTAACRPYQSYESFSNLGTGTMEVFFSAGAGGESTRKASIHYIVPAGAYHAYRVPAGGQIVGTEGDHLRNPRKVLHCKVDMGPHSAVDVNIGVAQVVVLLGNVLDAGPR